MSANDFQAWAEPLNHSHPLELAQALLEGFAPAADIRTLVGALGEIYTKPARHYHTFSHAVDVAHRIKAAQHAGWVDNPEPQFLRNAVIAALAHDAVYQPSADDNEAKSADVADSLFSPLGLSPTDLVQIRSFIMDTRHLDEDARFPLSALVRDADMAILASSDPSYDSYCRAVRQEYAWVSDEHWTINRTRFIQFMLERIERGRLFHVPMVATALQPRAAKNLARELASLKA